MLIIGSAVATTYFKTNLSKTLKTRKFLLHHIHKIIQNTFQNQKHQKSTPKPFKNTKQTFSTTLSVRVNPTNTIAFSFTPIHPAYIHPALLVKTRINFPRPQCSSKSNKAASHDVTQTIALSLTHHTIYIVASHSLA